MADTQTVTPAQVQTAGATATTKEHDSKVPLKLQKIHIRRPSLSLRTVLYGLTFALIFACTVALLGMVGYELHKYGDDYNNYGSDQYFHALGLLLFSTIISLLIVLSHPWLGVGFMSFCAFFAAVFFGTGAGVINRSAPYKGTFCATRPASEYPPRWQRFAGECGVVVAIQGFAWALWALYIFLMVGTILQKCSFRRRETPEGFYFAKEDA